MYYSGSRLGWILSLVHPDPLAKLFAIDMVRGAIPDGGHRGTVNSSLTISTQTTTQLLCGCKLVVLRGLQTGGRVQLGNFGV